MVPDATLRGRQGTAPRYSDELIDEASKESFPASDPPATWSGVTRSAVAGRDTDRDDTDAGN